MNGDLPEDLRPIVDFFGLPGTAPVAKDFHVVRAIRVLASLNATPFSLVFGGGTALARAHKLVRRMSEDVDFKIVPTPASPVSRSGLHRQHSALRDRVTAALQAAGFEFDPKDPAQTRSLDESSYTIWQLPYGPTIGAGQGLRPTIQVELNYAPLRRAPVMLPVASFVAEAMNRSPEVIETACVSILETAAEKLVALTRRTAMEMAGASRDPDPALVRHIYDLHMMRKHLDTVTVAALARDIATADAGEFRNQYPAYAADIEGETRKALDSLSTDALHRRRYDDFVSAMVYGEKAEFVSAFATVMELAETMMQR